MLDIDRFRYARKIFSAVGKEYITQARLKQLVYLLDRCAVDSGVNLEFGVFEGRTINAMAEHNPERRFWGFDSFDGLPEDWKLNKRHTIKAQTRWCLDELPEVMDNVSLVTGWFEKTLPEWINVCGGSPVRFLHIDSDLYSSAAFVLDELNEYIVPGTVICFDELCDFRLLEHPGVMMHDTSPTRLYTHWEQHEWRALNEWVSKYSRKVTPLSRTYSQSCGMLVMK